MISVFANKIMKLPRHVGLAMKGINQEGMRIVAVKGVHVVFEEACDANVHVRRYVVVWVQPKRGRHPPIAKKCIKALTELQVG